MLSNRYMNVSRQSEGSLQVQVLARDVAHPIANAVVNVLKATDSSQTPGTLERLITGDSGETAQLNLAAPPKEYSLNPQQPEKPYENYTISVSADGYETTVIQDVQILPETLSLQDVVLTPLATSPLSRQEQLIFIKPHTLWYAYPPKIPEDEVKELPPASGFVVLDKPVIPEFIVVHDGLPTDASAPNYYIPFKNYIKNVASSEIYSTWPASTIRSNVLAILSFTLNRVFTEWYRNQGKNFTITSSTAYDHAFFYGRNIYSEISVIVDEIFTTYITRPNIRQPLLTQYCDGVKVSCPNWMTQWGSKDLGDQGLSAVNILKSFYGSDIYLTNAEKVNGIPASFPGANLQQGSSGKDVRTIQNQLNAIAKNYPAIPKVIADGVYGQQTVDAVKKFQEVFHLPQTGIVDFPTWYQISNIYVAVEKLAELV